MIDAAVSVLRIDRFIALRGLKAVKLLWVDGFE